MDKHVPQWYVLSVIPVAEAPALITFTCWTNDTV